jgi:hypothetical protein
MIKLTLDARLRDKVSVFSHRGIDDVAFGGSARPAGLREVGQPEGGRSAWVFAHFA